MYTFMYAYVCILYSMCMYNFICMMDAWICVHRHVYNISMCVCMFVYVCDTYYTQCAVNRFALVFCDIWSTGASYSCINALYTALFPFYPVNIRTTLESVWVTFRILWRFIILTTGFRTLYSLQNPIHRPTCTHTRVCIGLPYNYVYIYKPTHTHHLTCTFANCLYISLAMPSNGPVLLAHRHILLYLGLQSHPLWSSASAP